MKTVRHNWKKQWSEQIATREKSSGFFKYKFWICTNCERTMIWSDSDPITTPSNKKIAKHGIASNCMIERKKTILKVLES